MRGAAALYVGLGLLQRAIGLLLLPFVTRSMSVAEYGMVALLAAGAALLNIVLSLAAEPSIVSASVRSSQDTDELAVLRAARVFLLVGAPIAAIVGAGLLLAVDLPLFGVPASLWAIEVLAMGVAVFAQTYTLPRLRVQLRLRAFAVVSLATILTMIASKIALVIVIPLGALGWAISDLLAALSSLVAALLVMTHDRLGKGERDFRKFFRLSVPLLPHLGALWIIGSIRIPLTEVALSVEDVGLFAAASAAGTLPMLFALEVNRATSVEYAHDKFPAPSPRSAAAMRLQLSVAVALVVGLCATTPLYVAVLLPASYAGIESVIAVLGFAAVFWTVYAITTSFTTMVARVVHLTWIPSTSAALVTIAGTLALGPLWGILGVAIAAVLAQVVLAAASLLVQHYLRLRLNWKIGGVTPGWLIRSSTAMGLAAVPMILSWPPAVWITCTAVGCLIAGGELLTNLRGKPGSASAKTP